MNLKALRTRWWIESAGSSGAPPPPKPAQDKAIIGELGISVLRLLLDYGYLTCSEIAEELHASEQQVAAALATLQAHHKVGRRWADRSECWYANEEGRRFLPERPSTRLTVGRRANSMQRREGTVPDLRNYLETIQRFIPKSQVNKEHGPCYVMGEPDPRTGERKPKAIIKETDKPSILLTERRAPQIIAMYQAGVTAEQIRAELHMDGTRVTQVIREAGIQRTYTEQRRMTREQQATAAD